MYLLKASHRAHLISSFLTGMEEGFPDPLPMWSTACWHVSFPGHSMTASSPCIISHDSRRTLNISTSTCQSLCFSKGCSQLQQQRSRSGMPFLFLERMSSIYARPQASFSLTHKSFSRKKGFHCGYAQICPISASVFHLSS